MGARAEEAYTWQRVSASGLQVLYWGRGHGGLGIALTAVEGVGGGLVGAVPRRESGVAGTRGGARHCGAFWCHFSSMWWKMVVIAKFEA